MPDDRTRLLSGPYSTPAFSYGQTAECAVRGGVELVGLTDPPIPWPVGKRGRHRAIVLYADLVRAVRRESAMAVGHWWGVGPQTVQRWRKALGVGAVTEGTSRLRADAAVAGDALRAAQERSRDAEKDAPRREKIRAAKLDKPRPRHVIEARGRVEAAKRRRQGLANP